MDLQILFRHLVFAECEFEIDKKKMGRLFKRGLKEIRLGRDSLVIRNGSAGMKRDILSRHKRERERDFSLHLPLLRCIEKMREHEIKEKVALLVRVQVGRATNSAAPF